MDGRAVFDHQITIAVLYTRVGQFQKIAKRMIFEFFGVILRVFRRGIIALSQALSLPLIDL